MTQASSESDLNSNKLKHLEMLQGVINRMAHCSFLLKGWSVVLVAGLFALAAKDANVLFIYVAYLPVIAFWILDGFYLFQERLYRNVYDKVRNLDPSGIDFAMDTRAFHGKNRATWGWSVASKTMLLFHLPLMVTIIVVMAVVLLTK